jgi:putative dimethyl sulfoxide reductase chaperone
MYAAVRTDLCRFLSACYYEPAPEFEEEKLFDSIVSAAAGVDGDLEERARRLRECFLSEPVDKLLLDYTRLFLGPNGALAQPYGSVWLSGEKTLMHDSTLALEALYADAGFELDDDFRELPDHIAAELEFLYLLDFRIDAARRSADVEALATFTRLRERLLAEHLARWVPLFTDAVMTTAQSAFYRELAALTHQFVALEARQPDS